MQVAYFQDMLRLSLSHKGFSTRLGAKLNLFFSPITNHCALCTEPHIKTFVSDKQNISQKWAVESLYPIPYNNYT